MKTLVLLTACVLLMVAADAIPHLRLHRVRDGHNAPVWYNRALQSGGCHDQCDSVCKRIHSPRQECSTCDPTSHAHGCYPGAPNYGPPTAEEEAETARLAIVAGITVCSMLEASIKMHVKYFWKQQEAERAFVQSLPVLCSVAPDEYYGRLHALRQPMSDAINRHVRGAFYVKAACTSACDEIIHDQIETHVCNFPVLDHEPFNLLEGSYVSNLTNHLLRGGHAALCNLGKEDGAKQIARWKRELEDVQKKHASNKAFDRLWDTVSQRYNCAGFSTSTRPWVATQAGRHVVVPCGATADGAACAAVRAASPTTEQVAAGLDEALRAPAQCMCAHAPCSPDTIIDMFHFDTLALLESARRTVVAASEACPGDGSDRSAARAERTAALARATLERRAHLKGQAFNPTSDTLFVSLSLGTVYHKLTSFCGRNYNNFKCDGFHSSNAGDHNGPITDLVPSLSPERCGADRCPVAADAIDRYHELLNRITAVRTRMLELFYRGHHDADNYEVRERVFEVLKDRLAHDGNTCTPARLKLVDDVLALPDLLREALRDLRAAAAADVLDVACVAGPREATVHVAPGTSAELLAFVQEAARTRAARDAGGLPLTVRVGVGPARPQSSSPPPNDGGGGGSDEIAHVDRNPEAHENNPDKDGLTQCERLGHCRYCTFGHRHNCCGDGVCDGPEPQNPAFCPKDCVGDHVKYTDAAYDKNKKDGFDGFGGKIYHNDNGGNEKKVSKNPPPPASVWETGWDAPTTHPTTGATSSAAAAGASTSLRTAASAPAQQQGGTTGSTATGLDWVWLLFGVGGGVLLGHLALKMSRAAGEDRAGSGRTARFGDEISSSDDDDGDDDGDDGDDDDECNSDNELLRRQDPPSLPSRASSNSRSRNPRRHHSEYVRSGRARAVGGRRVRKVETAGYFVTKL